MRLLRLKLFGGLDVRDSADRKITIAGTKAALLLAYLGLRPGEAHSRDKLIGRLWSDRGTSQARGSLRQALWALRRALEGVEPSPLIIEGETLALDPTAVATDILDFERLAADGSPEALQSAVTLYGDELLQGVQVRDPAFEEFLRGERQRLHELMIDVCGKLMAYQLKAGSDDLAVATAHRLLAIDPLQETAHRTLMEHFASKGQVGLAYKQYQTCCEVLRQELGVDPDLETERLFDRIRLDRADASDDYGRDDDAPEEPVGDRNSAPPARGKPSIAVLPFLNLSGDPE